MHLENLVKICCGNARIIYIISFLSGINLIFPSLLLPLCLFLHYLTIVIRGCISWLCDRRTNVKLSCVGDDFKIFLFVYTRKMDDGILHGLV